VNSWKIPDGFLGRQAGGFGGQRVPWANGMGPMDRGWRIGADGLRVVMWGLRFDVLGFKVTLLGGWSCAGGFRRLVCGLGHDGDGLTVVMSGRWTWDQW
jgi:hypothetical protein